MSQELINYIELTILKAASKHMNPNNQPLKVLVQILEVLAENKVPYNTIPNWEINGNKGLFISIQASPHPLEYIHVAYDTILITLSFNGNVSDRHIYDNSNYEKSIPYIDSLFSSAPKQIELFTLDRWLSLATKFNLGKCIYHELPVIIEMTHTGKWMLYMKKYTVHSNIEFTYCKNGSFYNRFADLNAPEESLFLFDEFEEVYNHWVTNVKEVKV